MNPKQETQLPLFSPVDENCDSIQLELKPYIQPFEQLLARAELAGLLGHMCFDQVFDRPAQPKEVVRTNIHVDILRKRLAYWERVGQSSLVPTVQVLFESSEDAAGVNSSQESLVLPRSRRLRYGPHDVHEYRGKFFPQLVRSLINFSGIEEGGVVLDPFCGSGTTNCEARVLGMTSLGLDLNPLSVLISRVKTSLLSVKPHQLQTKCEIVLETLEADVEGLPERRWSEADLRYLQRWFDPRALSELAAILHSIEQCSHHQIQDLLKICLSNIIRGVSWQKSTDLRVRKEVKEYTEGNALRSFKNEVKRQLVKLLPYLEVLQSEVDLVLLPDFDIQEGDVRKVDCCFRAYKGVCDLLITSPPYATALPYIDTDRLSLIVLGLLPRSEHRSREAQMTGNREVSESQRLELWERYQERRSELPKSVYQFIDELAEVYHRDTVGFRRRNLPSLLAKYFLDMAESMRVAREMMRPESYAFYVVGNNSTRIDGDRLEIPTDKFLWEIGREVGWHQEEVVDMELLPSRDIFRKNRGSAETILIFTSTLKRRSIYSYSNHKKFDAENSDWDFEEEDTQQHLHALHPYPARFIPQIPRKAILEYSHPAEHVLDPFCGCGTTLLESVLLGRPAIGVDNNEVAHLITRAKTANYSQQDLETLQEFGVNLINKLPEIETASDLWKPSYDSLPYWFDDVAVLDLSRVKSAIDQLPDNAHSFALAVFSTIIIRASYQDSDTRYARINRTYVQGSSVKWFQTKFINSLSRLNEIVNQPKSPSNVHLADARDLDFIPDRSVHLIVTSPPYLNAYDYHKYHRHRLQWIKGDVPFARNVEIGKHDVFTRPKATPKPYFDDMARCFAEWYRILHPRGRVIIVIGDAIVNGRAVAVADQFADLMQNLGLALEKRWIRKLQKRRKSFNQNARVDREHVLLFSKE